jgi:acetoin utilization deacetylase AcuC-like enzyme
VYAQADVWDDHDDCYRNSETALASRLAVGTTVDVTKAVLRGEAANGVAVVRPPGHHACCASSSGFCFFNNAAVAARVARENGVARVLIVDWDVHHGNGTQVFPLSETIVEWCLDARG